MRSLLLLLMVVSPLAAFGRIGETYEQCVARYGQPVDKQWDATIFVKNKVNVIINFDSSNRVECIGYMVGRQFTEKEIQVFLKVNANETWENRPADQTDQQLYYAPRANLTATCSGPILGVMTAAYKQRLDEFERRAKKREADRLQDF